MDWQDVAGKVVKAAPLVGTILGGPLGGAAGGLVSMLGGLFGITDDEMTPDALDQIIKTDPEALLKVRELELAHLSELQSIVLEQERIRLADIADARGREIEITKVTGTRDYNLYILAWLVIGGFFGLCAILTFQALPEGSSDIVYLLFGALAAGFGTVLQYFFGSSRSSAAKTDLLLKK